MAETVAAATRVSLRDYIGGERRAAAPGEMYEQRNPMRPDEVVAEVPACDAGAAVAAAHEAFPGWAAAPAPQRGNLLVKVADCTATRRIYVQDGVYDEFRGRFLDRIAQGRVGDPADPETEVGPIVKIYTQSLEAVHRFTNELQAGILHVNSQTAGAEVHVPFGGIKSSGWGPHEQGRAALEFYTELVTIYEDA